MNSTKARRRIVCTYRYADETGTTLYEVIRYEPKDFRCRVPMPGGGYSWSMKGVRKVLYALPALCDYDGDIVFVCEGEKDADAVNALGLMATTCQGSKGGWNPEFARQLIPYRVCILPDNDRAGEEFASVVAGSLDGVVRAWTICRLPDLPDKGDVTDWIESGRSAGDLLAVAYDCFDLAAIERAGGVGATSNFDQPADAPTIVGADEAWTINRIRFADIVDEDLAWLWEPFWLDHAVNILTGQPGVGKTFVACHLAAAISRGQAWPDGPGNAPLGDVVYLSSEDSLAKVLKKRLLAAGADLERVHTWTTKKRRNKKGELIELEVTLEDIEAMTAQIDDLPDLRLLIVDPVTAYLGSADANDNGEVRRVLNQVVKLAETKKFCVLFITHQKKSLANAINSTIGAQSFVAVARVVNGLFKDPDDEERKTRCLVPFKNNHGADVCGKRFRLNTPSGRGSDLRIAWDEEPETRSADYFMSAANSNAGFKRGESSKDEAKARNETAFLDVLDKMTSEAEAWVVLTKIRYALGWSGTRISSIVWGLAHDGILEQREGDITKWHGGVQEGGRTEVRRVIRKLP